MVIPILVALAAPPAKVPVAPGWTDNLKAAYALAKRENKSVLHLQLMGRLDDDFC